MAGYIGKSQGVTQVDGYNRTEADAEFVQVTGDTMTGALAVNGNLTVDTNTLFVDASSNEVGIGTSSPQNAIHVAAADATLRLTTTSDSGEAGIELWDNQSGTSQAAAIRYSDSSNLFTIQGNANGTIFMTPSNTFPSASEAMRIDSSGNLFVGTTDTNPSNDSETTGAMVFNQAFGGLLMVRRSSGECLSLNRTTTDGDIVTFRKDGTTVGSIGNRFNAMYIHSPDGSGSGLRFASNIIQPCANNGNDRDNVIDLGQINSRFDDIFATNGTIQTSDRNEKQDIEELDEAERRVAVAAKGLLRKFRWKDAVEEKGDDARIHFGIIAQDLQAAFEAEGLDAGRYAMFISSTWWEADEVVPAVDEVLDDEGNVVTEAQPERTVTNTYETAEEAPEGAVERTRMGIRYPQLLAFIIGAM